MATNKSANGGQLRRFCRYFPALVALIGLLVPLGCLSAPPAPVAEVEPTADVWGLIAQGETEQARNLFLGKTSVNSRDSSGRTPLHAAVENNNLDLARFFLVLNAEVDARDTQGRTPLEMACRGKNAELVRLLVDFNAAIFLAGSENKTPVDYALERDSGILNALLTDKNINTLDSGDRTILHIAARAGNLEAVRLILSRSANVALKDKAGNSVLDAAYSNPGSREHAAVAELLILSGAQSADPSFAYFPPAVRSANFNIRFDDGLAPLHFAAREGHLGFIRFLLDKKADIRAKNGSGAPPLHEAIRAGQLEAAKLLLDSGADVNARDAKGNSALHIVMPADTRLAGTELLLSRKADANLKDDYGDAPLHVSISLNMGTAITAALLRGGADPNIRNTSGRTPLHICLEKDRDDYIPLLLERGADIFAADTQGYTPFALAVQKGQRYMEMLLNPTTVTASDNRGFTALHIAINAKVDASLVSLILDRNADVNARNKSGDTPLHIAIANDSQANGELLLSRGADIFATNAEGKSPLFLAAWNQAGFVPWMLVPSVLEKRDGFGNTILHHLAAWKLDRQIPIVLERGVSLETVNASGETPLFAAVKANSPTTIETLIKLGASTRRRDSLGNTALHAAIRWNAPQAAEVLVKLGAEINAQNLAGKTPLHEAIRLGMADSEQYLLNSGARLEARDQQGNTPLMEAIASGLLAPTLRMLERGSNVSTRNLNGDTPLHLAVTLARRDLVEALLARGASIHSINAAGMSPFKMVVISNSSMTQTLLTRDRINRSDDEGNTPLHLAILAGAQSELLRTICAMGADTLSIDAQGRTPINLAMERSAYGLVRVLVECGSEVFTENEAGESALTLALKRDLDALKILVENLNMSATDRLGNTVLHYAAYKGSKEAVQLLLQMGAPKNARNVAGETPFDLAQRWGKSDNASLLAE